MTRPSILTSVNGTPRTVDTATYLLERYRIIPIIGEINDEMAMETMGLVMKLDELPDEPITLLVNSPGGSVSAGYMIIDCMKAAESTIRTVATGMAASMGALIVASGSPGYRFAMENAEIMLHQPLGGASGYADDIEIISQRLMRTKKRIASTLSRVCRKSTEEVKNAMLRDTWFTPAQALAFGLVDHVASQLPSEL